MTKDNVQSKTIKGSKNQREFIVVGIAFTIFFAVISFNLTNASLWYDETVEYWYSKYFMGILPWQNDAISMYERIVSTYQPPLFNVLMHFWLMIHDAEWWMRLFGVLMGLIGAAGVYKTISFGSHSRYKASIAIIIYAMIYRLTYYWQEVAEYALMLGLLSWTVYYFLRVIKKPDTKTIILFVIFCILPVYSQYGAVFPIIAFAVLAFIKVISDKNKKNIAVISGSYAFAAIFAAIPLYFCFLRPQMERQGSAEVTVWQSFSIKNFWNDFVSVFEYSFVKDIGRTGHHVMSIIIIVFIIAAILYLVKGKHLWMKYLLVANMICYTLYYFAVFFGFYANNSYTSTPFGNRYNLFLIPLWFVTSLMLVDLIIKEMITITASKYVQTGAALAAGCTIAVLFCWSYLGWTSISNNWSKENIRGATAKWVSEEGYDTDTIIYQYARSGFSYYLTHTSTYDDSMFEKVVFQEGGSSAEDKSDEKEWVNSVYGEDWPSSLYIVVSHVYRGVSLDNLINTFTNAGYTSTDIFNSNGGRLIYLEKE